MTNGRKRGVGEVDVEMVRQLAQVLVEAGLTEIEYVGEEWQVRLAKQVTFASPLSTVPSAPVGLAAPPPVTVSPAAADGSAKSETDAYADHPGLLTSPMVGIAYISAEPSSPPFVSVGDAVAVGDTVLLIEAMKVFNPIKAHRAGRVERIFVAAGTPVEYGEPLLLIV